MTDPGDQGSVHAAVVRDIAGTRERIESLERELASIVESADSANIDDEHDPEGSTIAYERAMVISLLESSRSHLTDLEVALGRVTDDGAVPCGSCGAQIAVERMLALPAATMCTACADRSSAQR